MTKPFAQTLLWVPQIEEAAVHGARVRSRAQRDGKADSYGLTTANAKLRPWEMAVSSACGEKAASVCTGVVRKVLQMQKKGIRHFTA